MKTLREEPTCSRSHKLEGTDSQSRCLDPSLSVLLLWLQTVGLQMAAQKPLGFQTRALVPLSSVIRSSRGSGCLPRSVLLGQSLPSLSFSFHSVLIRGPVTECWGERVLLGGDVDVPSALWWQESLAAIDLCSLREEGPALVTAA